MIREISNNNRLIVIVFIVMLSIIAFESAQQLYYVKRYAIAPTATFLGIFKKQSLSWFVWAIFSLILIDFTKKKTEKETFGFLDLTSFVVLIISLIFIDVCIIATIQILNLNIPFPWSVLFQEYIPFYAFQKIPIYTLAYIAIAMIFYYYYLNKQLQVEVLQLGELKKTNANLYAQLSATHPDKVSVLTIKIGNKHKLIPTDEINWIEADDYCSKIHTPNNNGYSMRISLKALEQKLSPHFLRVHRSAIVNMKMVKEFHANNTNILLLKNGTEVPVSQSKLKVVKEFITKF